MFTRVTADKMQQTTQRRPQHDWLTTAHTTKQVMNSCVAGAAAYISMSINCDTDVIVYLNMPKFTAKAFAICRIHHNYDSANCKRISDFQNFTAPAVPWWTVADAGFFMRLEACIKMDHKVENSTETKITMIQKCLRKLRFYPHLRRLLYPQNVNSFCTEPNNRQFQSYCISACKAVGIHMSKCGLCSLKLVV